MFFENFKKSNIFFNRMKIKIVDRFGGLSYGLFVSQIDVLQDSKKFFLELVFSFLGNCDFLKHISAS